MRGGEESERERSHNHFPIRTLIFLPLKDTLQSWAYVWTIRQESIAQLYTKELCNLAACIWRSHKSDQTHYTGGGLLRRGQRAHSPDQHPGLIW